jgi:hypothetical protein
MVFDRTELEAIGGSETFSDDNDPLLATLRNISLIVAAGTLCDLGGASTAIFTEEFLVTFAGGVNRTEIEKILAVHGCTVVEYLDFISDTYRVSAGKSMGDGIVNVLETINGLEQVEKILPDIRNGVRSNAPKLTPSDYLWQYTWSGEQVRADEAWKYLETKKGADKAFGDASLNITVIDTGIKSASGEPIHEEFKGHVPGSTTATLSANYDHTSIRSVLLLDTDTTFTGGEKVSLNRTGDYSKVIHLVEDINPGDKRKLTIDPLYFNHPAYTPVYDQFAIYLGQLIELVPEAKSVINVAGVSGPGFSKGQILQVGNVADADIEQVRILEVAGTTITTTPLLNNHVSGVTIATGRKMLRFQDLRTGSSPQNNDGVTINHGVAVAGIAGGNANNTIDVAADVGGYGTAGIAANCQIISAYDGDFASTLGNANYSLLQWSAGVSRYSPSTPWLNFDHHVVNWSRGIGLGDDIHNATSISKGVIESTVRQSRNRRGSLIFLSAGNENEPQPHDLWSSHPATFSCAASRSVMQIAYKDSNPHAGDWAFREIRSPFSNYTNGNSEVSFCAPSGLGLANNHHNGLFRNIIAPDFKGWQLSKRKHWQLSKRKVAAFEAKTLAA